MQSDDFTIICIYQMMHKVNTGGSMYMGSHQFTAIPDRSNYFGTCSAYVLITEGAVTI